MKRTFILRILILLAAATAVFTACVQQQSSTSATPQPTTASIEPVIEPTETPIPTAAPALPVQFSGDGLQAILHSEQDLEDFLPDAPITVYFSEPMNSANSRPLLFSPSITGTFSWNAENTIITFTPQPAFKSGSSYTVSLNASLKSSTGGTIRPIERWRLHMRTVPTVVRRIPRDTQFNDYTPTIQLHFNRPMDPAAVQSALSVTPGIDFATSWEDEGLRVTLTEPMQFGQDYEFTLAKTAVDTTGFNLITPYTWQIRLKDTVSSTAWPILSEPARPVRINFNYPIDTARLDHPLAIEPPVDGKWAWNTAKTQAVFQPNGRFSTETTYTVTFPEKLFDQAGNTLPLPQPFTFTTPPAILSAAPNQGSAHPTSRLAVQFDRPMDQTAVETAVSIDPPITGAFTWSDNTLTFQPENGYFATGTKYTVTIAPSPAADGELVMHEPYSWSFTTGELSALASFGNGPNAQVVDENGRRAIHFQAMTVNPITVNFELFQFDLTQFLSAYTGGFENYWWGDQTIINTTPLRPVTQWQMETIKGANDWENIQETILPDALEPGLYVLNLSAGTLNDQLFVILSDSTIAAKIAGEQLVTWVTDINGDVLPDVPVRVYARDGRLLTAGATNGAGIFESSLANFHDDDTNDETPMLIVAENKGTWAVTGLQNTWRQGGYWYWQSTTVPDAYAAYVYTDRPIYRPGQTVYFKAIVRQDDDAVLSLLPAGTAVSAQIRDTRNNLVTTIDLRTNDFGTVNGEFAIADGAMLGTYQIELVINGESHQQAFKVEDYRKPDYEVTVTTDSDRYFKRDSIQITVDTRYFFDEPVANATVEINRFDLLQNNEWTGQPGDYIWYKSYGTPLRGTTDENGRYTTTILVPSDIYFNDYDYYSGSSLQQITWGIEATVNDGSNQNVSGFAVAKIYNTNEKLTINHNGYSQEPGKPFTIRAAVTDLGDAPVAHRQLTVDLSRYNSSSYNYDINVQTIPLTTDTAGTAATQITIAESGYYQLSVHGLDSKNRPIEYKSWLYVFDDNPFSWYGSNNNIRIVTEKETYAPGETAVLLIESEFGGPALLTIERGTVRREQLVTLTPPITRVNLPITPTDVPNIHVTINAWEPQETTLDQLTYESIPDSSLRTATVNLSVPATDKQLTVTITPDQESYALGDEATFTVRVTNYAGIPVSAEVSMALVDDAIFALSEELSGPIYDGFYFERENRVRTYNSMAPLRYLGGGWGGGGGGDAPATLRQDFQDTAVWLPTLTTDFNGEATVTITLPDNLTRWRMTAKATTADTQVGEAVTTIVTQQDVLIRPLLPRILTAGDSLQLTGLLHNNTDQPQGLAVTLQEAGSTSKLSITAPITQTLLLEPGEVRAVGWSVTAVEAGISEIIMTAHHNASHPSGINLTGIADSVQHPLEIQPLAIPNVDVEIGQFTGAHTANIALPDDAMEMSTINIRLSRSIAGSMLDGLNDLTGYPYGCVEQTMSKAFPNAVVGRALNQLGIPMPDELPQQISASVQRLYGFQHDDGGWGWWYDDKTDAYQTAWVLFGLTQTAQAGYEIDPAVMERGASWLKENLRNMDVRTRAFALYSMALAGHGDITATQQLLDQPDRLDTFAYASLALALYEMGDTVGAFAMVETLTEAVIAEEGRAHWPGATGDGAYDRKTMASATRNTAIALSAFATIRPGHPLEADIVRWLMSQRRQFGWGTTNETAFAVLGLTDHLLASGYAENAGETAFNVSVNGEPFSSGTLHRGEPTTTVTIPRAALGAENEIVITQDGERPLYFVITSRIYRPQGSIEAEGNVTIRRVYIDMETGKPTTTFTTGQLVKVQLTVMLPDAAAYLLIEDKLPAGLEALNEGLNTSSHVKQGYEEVHYYWEDYGYNQKEIRGDRVSFFVTELNAGSRVFSYITRATQSGDFTAMPTELSAMYDPTLWGHSASDGITIRGD